MTERTRSVLKNYFNTGDHPTEDNFADVVDTLVTVSELLSHASDATAIHGITDTSVLETVTGSQAKVDTAFSNYVGTLGNLLTTAKDLLVSAINELYTYAYGGASIHANLLKAWTEGESYELTAITWDSDGVATTATAKWPDGSAGTFTRDTKNTTWLAIDAYHITHTTSGKTVTQAAVTRDANGNVTTKPALTVA